MNKDIFAFLLTFMAGFSTMLGCILIFVKAKNANKIITSSLSFASGVMICVSITDLIPESLKLLKNSFNSYTTIVLSFLAILLGIIVSMIISYYLPDSKIEYQDKSLFKVGIISMLAIVLHNIPEDCIKYVSQGI